MLASRWGHVTLWGSGLLVSTLLSCSSGRSEVADASSEFDETVAGPELPAGGGREEGSSASQPGDSAPTAPASEPATAGVAPTVPGSDGTPTPVLTPGSTPASGSSGAPAADMGQAPMPPASAAPAPVVSDTSPPVSDTASPLPIARQGGYTTDPNIVYGPLPQHRLDVLYPPAAGPNGTQKLPGVIMFHGGGWIQGDKATMSSFYSRFLAHGFIVATVEYRVAPQGIAPAAVEDALLAAKWFWDHLDYYNVDRTKFIVTGASAGAHLALMVGMAPPEAGLGPTQPTDFQIAAIVNGYGPTDVPDMLQRNIDFALQWLPVGTPDRDAIARRVSPVSYVREGLPPLLTVQGSNDTTVPVAEGEELHTLLQAIGADAEHHLVAGAGHGFSTPATAWPDAEATIFDFLVRHGIGK